MPNWTEVIAHVEADVTSPEAIKTAITVLTAIENKIEAATGNPFAVQAEHLLFQAAVAKLTSYLPPVTTTP